MSFLEDMVALRRASVEEEFGTDVVQVMQRLTQLDTLADPERRPVHFEEALREPQDIAIIAEVKKASPSVGPIAPHCDAAEQASAYERGGAAAVSVLTEPEVFRGGFRDLAGVTAAVRLPALCKDFIVSPVQLHAACAARADAVLLMACVLGKDLAEYVETATALGLTPLVEVVDERELEIALSAGATLIGVNARDFKTLEVDLSRQRAVVAAAARTGAVVVAASGIRRRDDVEVAAAAGASAVLVGEALMRAPIPEDVIKKLTGVRKERGDV